MGWGIFFVYFFEENFINSLMIIRIHIQAHSYKVHCQFRSCGIPQIKKCFLFFKNVTML